MRAPLKPAPATAAVRELVRKHIKGVGPDRVVAPELAAAEELIRTGAIIAAAQAVTGPLK
jgi:histidine ammonia-lyase